MNKSLFIIRHHCEIIFQAIEKIEATIQQLPEADRKIIQHAMQLDNISIASRVVAPDPNLKQNPPFLDVEDKTSNDIELDDPVSCKSCVKKDEHKKDVTETDEIVSDAPNEIDSFPRLEELHHEREESQYDHGEVDTSFEDEDSSLVMEERDEGAISTKLIITTQVPTNISVPSEVPTNTIIPSEDRVNMSIPYEGSTNMSVITETSTEMNNVTEFSPNMNIPFNQSYLNFDLIHEDDVTIGDESLGDDNKDEVRPSKTAKLSTKPKRRVSRVFRSPKKWRRLILNHRLRSIFIDGNET
jgi:hypothetical protein